MNRNHFAFVFSLLFLFSYDATPSYILLLISLLSLNFFMIGKSAVMAGHWATILKEIKEYPAIAMEAWNNLSKNHSISIQSNDIRGIMSVGNSVAPHGENTSMSAEGNGL